MIAPDIKYVTLVFLRKSIEIFLNNPFVSEVEKSNFPPLLVFHSISILVIKIAVNNEVIIPINKVVAKPLIGPVPKENKISAVKPVVIFASNIEDKAFAKPSSIAATCFLPFIISSLTLS